MLFHAYCRLYQLVFKIISPLLPWREPQLLEGAGSIGKLPQLLQDQGLGRILIVTDKGLISLGLLDGLYHGLKKHSIAFWVYDGTVPNPTIDNIESAARIFREHQCQAIIAFGGGSPMDCAKGVGARVVRPGTPIARMKGVLRINRRLPPLIAVPTTAGTGSEATLAAVISNPQTHEKYPVNDPVLIPHYAVLDPELTLKLPPYITATTGMDALTHAIEAFIGRSNTKETEQAAIEATRLILENLEAVYDDGQDVERRARLLRAAYLAGKAFTRAYVGYVHAIAHTLGGFYGIAHGLANSVVLPHVLEYYGKAAEARLAQLARLSGLVEPETEDCIAAERFLARIKSMNKHMNIPEFIEGIQTADIPVMVERAHSEANPLYPVPKILNRPEIRELYSKISQIPAPATIA